MEKLIQRSLWMKYENQSKEVENSKTNTENGHELSKSGFNNFLSFFQVVSQRDQERFKKAVADNCEVKTVKKANVVSQD